MNFSNRSRPPWAATVFALVMLVGFGVTAAAAQEADHGLEGRDEKMALTFVGGAPGVMDGKSVRVYGIDEDIVRLTHLNKWKNVKTDKFVRMKLDGARWTYEPAKESFSDMVDELALDKQHKERFGAVGYEGWVVEALAAHLPKDPDPAEVVETPKDPPPPPPAADPKPLPNAPPPEVTTPVEAEAESADEPLIPKNVPDWVKWLSAAAAVIVVIKFFRN